MIYLDNAATTWPKPETVYQKMDQFLRELGANPGRAGHKMAAEAGRQIFEVREKIAAFFGAADSSEIVFTSNATHSLNFGLHGVVEQGDHVITSCLEHNSVFRPLKELERSGMIELTVIGLTAEGDLDYAELERSIRPHTKLIAMIHGSNVTGHIFDLQRICGIAKAKGVLIMIDAAQTAGVFPIDLRELPIDLLALPGHKSLYGPPGTGILYVRTGTPMRAIFAGGTGSKSEEVYQPELLPDKYESGSVNSVGIAGLGAGVDFVQTVGMDTIREHELHLCHRMIEGLLVLPKVTVYGPALGMLRTPVISFNIGTESSSEIGYILDQVFDIGVRSGLHCSPLAHQTMGTVHQGMIRASFGYFNTTDDVEQALAAITEITAKVG